MTSNQIAYHSYAEQARSNLENEGIKKRANDLTEARDAETAQHNRAMEDFNMQNMWQNAENVRYQADRNLEGTRYSADSSRAAQKYTADSNLQGTRYTADTQASTANKDRAQRERASIRDNQSRVYAADRAHDASVTSAGIGASANRYNSDTNRYIADSSTNAKANMVSANASRTTAQANQTNAQSNKTNASTNRAKYSLDANRYQNIEKPAAQNDLQHKYELNPSISYRNTAEANAATRNAQTNAYNADTRRQDAQARNYINAADLERKAKRDQADIVLGTQKNANDFINMFVPKKSKSITKRIK